MNTKRNRIDGLGGSGLMFGAISTDILRLIFSVPLFSIPVIGPPAGFLMGFGIGLASWLGFTFTYKMVFDVGFGERFLPRILLYFFGSGIPFGTTVATGVTVALIVLDDARYNRKALHVVQEPLPSRPPPDVVGNDLDVAPAPRNTGSI